MDKEQKIGTAHFDVVLQRKFMQKYYPIFDNQRFSQILQLLQDSLPFFQEIAYNSAIPSNLAPAIRAANGEIPGDLEETDPEFWMRFASIVYGTNLRFNSPFHALYAVKYGELISTLKNRPYYSTDHGSHEYFRISALSALVRGMEMGTDMRNIPTLKGKIGQLQKSWFSNLPNKQELAEIRGGVNGLFQDELTRLRIGKMAQKADWDYTEE